MFDLKKVSMEDALCIFELRQNENKGKYLNQITLESHINWLRNQIQLEDDYYFSVKNRKNNNCEGFISLYNVNYLENKAEWGRWIMVDNSPAIFNSYFLILDFGFKLALDEIYCKTDVRNTNALRIHDHLPYSDRELTVENNKTFVKHTLKATDWDVFKLKLEKYLR